MEKKKIMVIDDEEDFLRVVKLNMEETNEYEVLTLSSAKDIISEIYQFRPKLILLDMLMPLVGGIDAGEMLNNDPYGKSIPVIILSALDKDADKLMAYKIGVVDYLTKPIEANDLIAKIEKALKDK